MYGWYVIRTCMYNGSTVIRHTHTHTFESWTFGLCRVIIENCKICSRVEFLYFSKISSIMNTGATMNTPWPNAPQLTLQKYKFSATLVAELDTCRPREMTDTEFYNHCNCCYYCAPLRAYFDWNFLKWRGIEKVWVVYFMNWLESLKSSYIELYWSKASCWSHTVPASIQTRPGTIHNTRWSVKKNWEV